MDFKKSGENRGRLGRRPKVLSNKTIICPGCDGVGKDISNGETCTDCKGSGKLENITIREVTQ